ncbi:hypothetical protein MRX96_031675 [Rhipicephalus microplus]
MEERAGTSLGQEMASRGVRQRPALIGRSLALPDASLSAHPDRASQKGRGRGEVQLGAAGWRAPCPVVLGRVAASSSFCFPFERCRRPLTRSSAAVALAYELSLRSPPFSDRLEASGRSALLCSG